MLTGIILILIGTILLLKNLGIISMAGAILWPSLLIIMGIALIVKRK